MYYISHLVIVYVYWNVPLNTDSFVLHTDTSQLVVSVVLSVSRNKQELPAAFFSRQF